MGGGRGSCQRTVGLLSLSVNVGRQFRAHACDYRVGSTRRHWRPQLQPKFCLRNQAQMCLFQTDPCLSGLHNPNTEVT